MTDTQETNSSTLPLKLPLLRSDSSDQYVAVVKRLKQELKPKGIVELFYIEDIASLIFEIRRLQRCKTNVISKTHPEALNNLLRQLLVRPDSANFMSNDLKAKELARKWFTDETAKEEASEILRRFNLDEMAIEAEAIRLKAADLQLLDRMLALARSRFDKALRSVTEYQESFARRLQYSSDNILHNNEVACLEQDANH